MSVKEQLASEDDAKWRKAMQKRRLNHFTPMTYGTLWSCRVVDQQWVASGFSSRKWMLMAWWKGTRHDW